MRSVGIGKIGCVVAVAAGLGAFSASSAPQAPEPAPKASAPLGVVTEAVDVRGAVLTPLHLRVQDLRAFPPEQLAEVVQPPKSPNAGPGSRLRGVRLTALLERAKLSATGHNDWKRVVVLATASDNYRVVFSWSELFNTEIGRSALVVFERDGKPLDDGEGRLAMFVGADQNPGPRRVRWLQTLEVRLLE